MRKYELIVTEEKERLEISSTNEGFCPLELIGLLTLKIDDIKKQMAGEIRPDVMKRTVVVPKRSEDEEATQ